MPSLFNSGYRILINLRRMGIKREIQNMSSDSVSDVSKSPSEFDLQLQNEIERAKSEKRIKEKNKRFKKPSASAMRDEAGFKVRVVDTNGDKKKQDDPDYKVIIDGPLRRIEPYYFTYKTFCKLRWRDRKLLDVFVTEFRDREESYYKKTIAGGLVFLNDKPANLESIIRNGDLITHNVHRHEPPVTSRPIKTVFEDDNILVIDKPSGIPVHPTGRFRFNTITKILEKKLGYSVHPCNRLDKLTSGLMFLAKTPKGADEMADQLKAREVTKEYVARVVGEFPVGEVTVEKPVKTVDPRVSLNSVCSLEDENAKHAKTIFNRVSYDGKTSIVKCKPLTGRTHQIRVHLQYIGFPIANDPIYSNPHVWGPGLGNGGDADFEDVIKKLNEIGKTTCSESWINANSEGELLRGEKCEVCETDLYTDPGPNDLNLWLHAYRYESTEFDENQRKNWSYRTDFPDWALQSNKKYMELALEEAKKCPPTKTAFSVGAILANGTEVLSTGYSRELEGNTHAEQCALEKYFTKIGKREVPLGSVLYTTMEPCSYRLSGNKPCLERILDAKGRIGSVFVGVLEPDTFVKNNVSFDTLTSNGIDYIQIPGYEEECINAARKGHDE
ncbi:hypothetical protein Kpol_1032p14 [Vanderwaltozyma polyspora DSM 70294]|uniref:tRNA pseudouridine(32) synthase n=1 Tax=Vanderwaltozyma polyspora (strain ATCC 22028 / DSM 70294 / BCRC 21397 / CBS 2163 / NBRC 10782 / NRRL Y-8283 / UCD 57-17) TaxID=436907 RepID=A7TGX0_VANPO|nr:uncharacterized protein Kpol_1032p14 [Vanderwaltozyma polyspora DSM 70294]EDO18422.1 hypothetical protein Kpol_1032p14 [Vanderwaltozyma polyspora DSM 70294]